MNESGLLRPIADACDFEALRFPGEDVIRRELERKPTAVEQVRKWCSPAECPAIPQGAHFDAFRASPSATPGLSQLEETLQYVLRLDARPQIVVFPSSEPFVGPLNPSGDRECRVLASSAVFARIDARDALFQIGRKLAWRLLDQWPLLADPTTGRAKPERDALMIRGLWKFQELTSDRIGLLCCQDVELASRSVLRFASGLPHEMLDVEWPSLLRQRISEEEAMLADSPYQFALLRAAALRQFASEVRYTQSLAPRSPVMALVSNAPPISTLPLVSDDVIDAEVVAFAADARAADRESSPGPSATLREFSLWAVLWVVGMDDRLGDAAPSELWEAFGSAATAALDEVENHGGAERCAVRCADAAWRCFHSSPTERRSAMENVGRIVSAIRAIAAKEIERIGDVAELLDVDLRDIELDVAVAGGFDTEPSAFLIGDDVEVERNGAWVAGVVHSVDAELGVQVYFPSLAETRRLHPSALRIVAPVQQVG